MTNKEKVLTGYPTSDKPWLRYYSDEAKTTPLPELTAYEYLRRSSDGYEHDVALNYYDRKITYEQMFDEIEKAACAFTALGVRRGDVVTILSVTTPEIVYAFYALNRIGAVTDMIDPRTNLERVKIYMDRSKAKFVLAVDKCVPLVKKLTELGFNGKTIYVSPSDSLSPLMKIGYKLTNKEKYDTSIATSWNDFIKAGRNASFTDAPYRPRSDAVIVYTGGTTGIPKGAVLSDDSLNTIALQYRLLGVDYKRGENFLNIMPPFVAYGVVCGIHMCLSMGLSNVIIPLLDTEKLDSLVIKYKPVLMLGVPMHYEVLAKSPKMKNLDMSFFKIPGCGGDGMSEKIENDLNDFLLSHGCECKITKGYGMTEVGSAAITCIGSVNKLGSVGIPHCKTTVSVFEPDTDKELPYNTEGEICLQTSAMMNGYIGNEEETNKVIRTHSDGSLWVHSGDIGYMDEDGFIFVKGRMKRMIIRPDGHNVFPTAIENTILDHEAVADCSVVGKKDKSVLSGAWPVAFIILKDGYKDNKAFLEDIRAYCSQKLPPRDTASEFYEIDTLPYTSIGKVDYRALEELADKM